MRRRAERGILASVKPEPVQFCVDTPLEGEWCEVPSLSSDDDYTVIITDPEDPGEWSCTCEGYRFRSYCSHQERAWDAFCHWISTEGPEQQTPEEAHGKVCPRCGGPTDRIWRRNA